jgi:hypothetical protein
LRPSSHSPPLITLGISSRTLSRTTPCVPWLSEHHAWIARQHYSFARLAASETIPAASAVAIGGPLTQQHSASSLSAMINPGPYLEDAALAMAQRRLCLQSKGGVDPPPLAPGGTGPRHWGQPEGGGGGSTEEDVARAKVMSPD